MLARIYKPAKNAMQSGMARTREWVLEFEPASARKPDPLMGWTSTTDLNGQIRLSFDTREEAVAYAQRGRGERKRPASGWASLTPAEGDVARLICEGLANKEIATRLFVSPRTVQARLSHIYTKLGIASRVQLVQEAARHA